MKIVDKLILEIHIDTFSPMDALDRAYNTLVKHCEPHEIEIITIIKPERHGKYGITVIARYIDEEDMHPAWY